MENLNNKDSGLLWKYLAELSGDKNWFSNIKKPRKYNPPQEPEEYDSSDYEVPDPFDGDPDAYWNID